MSGKGLTWTTAHLRSVTTPEDVRSAVAEAGQNLGDAAVPAATVLQLLEELALDGARLREGLRSATRVREVLLASVAHDLRNPLNTFAMSAGLLRDDLEGPNLDRTRALALVSRMDRASGRMQSLIDDLLIASKIEAGAMEISRRAEPASAVVADTVAAASPMVTEKGARIEAGSVDDTVTVEVDRAKMVEALVKLVSVYLKSTGEGGSLRLGVERNDDTVVFSLRALQARSGSVAPPDDARGGLALLIARGLIAAQGGQLATETSPEGSRSIVIFPLAHA